MTFLCLVYNRKQSFPPTRSRLYNKALDILLEEWAAEKRLPQEKIHEGLHTDLEKVMLAEIAYGGFLNNQLFFDLTFHVIFFDLRRSQNPNSLSLILSLLILINLYLMRMRDL